jgi:hypothetical protein
LNPIQAHYQAVLRPEAKEAQDAARKWDFQAGKAFSCHARRWQKRGEVKGRKPLSAKYRHFVPFFAKPSSQLARNDRENHQRFTPLNGLKDGGFLPRFQS